MPSLWTFLLHTYVVCVILVIGAKIINSRLEKRATRRRSQQGFQAEYIGTPSLGAGPDDFAVVYREGEYSHRFPGKIERTPGRPHKDVATLHVPDETHWQAQMPEWLQDRREIILQRIKRDLFWLQFAHQPSDDTPSDNS